MRFATIILSLLPFALARPTERRLSLEDIDAGHQFQKRQSFGGRATFYDVGLGACGGYNVASDYIVALNAPQYGGGYPGPQCGKTITISYGGKTAQATIRDLCPGCGYGDLDMSRGLFNHFSDEGAGVFQMNWWFNDGSNSGGQQQQQQQEPEPTTSAWTPPPATRAQTPTSTWSPTPESTYTPPTPTSSTQDDTSSATPLASAPASPSSSYSNSTDDSASASAAVSVTISGSVVSAPISTAPITGLGNLALLNQIVTNYGAVIIAGAST